MLISNTRQCAIRILNLSQRQFNRASTISFNNRFSAYRFFTNKSFVFNESSSIKDELVKVLESEYVLEQSQPLLLEDVEKDYIHKHQLEIENTISEKLVKISKKLPDGQKLHIFFDSTELNEIYNAGLQRERLQREAEEEAEEEDEDADGSIRESKDIEAEFPPEDIPMNVNFIIENPAKNQSLGIHSYLLIDDMRFITQSMTVYKDNQYALSVSSAAQYAKNLQYSGPDFDLLEDSVQEFFELYLQDIGVDYELARFIVEFSKVKENDEYVNWLKDLHHFFK
ncbi:hypothetical protein PACTADRAFT_33843 [Pachysolen tannophilus NRRL Y-2460]|uniref:Mitochondrial acidic protein MAM33 n=1 Tax=Pachysolen tannophilus NRRL Y-2460 TaxID=669874 RepID=A0A1E4TU38_PACTA|nr:hypothetical protein PACTADRAFT_33843 [Pachysolen tannophilus NRRL Y-2460]